MGRQEEFEYARDNNLPAYEQHPDEEKPVVSPGGIDQYGVPRNRDVQMSLLPPSYSEDDRQEALSYRRAAAEDDIVFTTSGSQTTGLDMSGVRKKEMREGVVQSGVDLDFLKESLVFVNLAQGSDDRTHYRRGDSEISMMGSQSMLPSNRAFMHELGHHWHLTQTHPVRHLMGSPTGYGHVPNPINEAHADAFADLYHGVFSHGTKPETGAHGDVYPPPRQTMKDENEPVTGRSVKDFSTGYGAYYSTKDDYPWTDTERALYAAVRTHVARTEKPWDAVNEASVPTVGEAFLPSEYTDSGHNAHVDAYVAHLMQFPHVRDRLDEMGLRQYADHAVARHADRVEIEAQFHERRAFEDKLNPATNAHLANDESLHPLLIALKHDSAGLSKSHSRESLIELGERTHASLKESGDHEGAERFGKALAHAAQGPQVVDMHRDGIRPSKQLDLLSEHGDEFDQLALFGGDGINLPEHWRPLRPREKP